MAFQPMARQQHWVVEDHARLPSVESDLCCMEDAWDSLSSSSSSSSSSAAGGSAFPRGAAMKQQQQQQQQQQQRRAGGARLPTHTERAQLRRSRPSAPGAVCKGDERIDCLLGMVRAQHKFMPAGVTGSGGRALCHSVSPFVAERRGLFVAWENQMATFLGYSRDTVAVALNYFDRYTCAKTCSPTLAQAVAATALHIAAKFEETNPASLRQLLKYTPVFTPEQLLLMEMSLLKVLNWDLRPVTVYDFIRAFCTLLVPGGAGGESSAATASAGSSFGVAVTLQCKEEKEKELERLGVGAEDIADLASFDVCFVDFLPSTLAAAALLLSVSRGTSTTVPSSPDSATTPSSGLLRPTSHADVLDTCRKVVDPDAGADADGGAAGPLHRVLECVQLLGSSLAERYPAVGAASASAAEALARYAGLPVPSGTEMAHDVTAAAGVTPPPGPSKVVTTTPVAVAKARRCATPTGVEGIMHIEMDAIRSASGGVGGAEEQGGREQTQDQQQQSLSCSEEEETEVVVGGANDSVHVGSGSVAAAAPTSTGKQQHQRRRPTAFMTTSGVDCSNKAGLQQHQQYHSKRVRSESFTYTNEEIAFSRAAKQKNNAQQAAGGCGGGASTIGGSERVSEAAAAVISNTTRKRSAEALGHCESGSGFGAPPARFGGSGGRVPAGSSSSSNKVARLLI